MKKIFNLIGVAAMLGISAQAQTTLTAWNFDTLPAGYNASPAPISGTVENGTASTAGFGNGSSNPSIANLPGGSFGATNGWQFAATGGSDGWNTNAAIGTQGAKFVASTVGYYQIKASFDVYATTNAEAALQVQYTTEGAIWHNANIISAGTSGYLATNTITTNGLAVGTYIVLTNNGTAAWDNGVQVDLSGISGVDNDANFAIRIVNAATGTNCLDTTGAHYNNSNTTAKWAFANVAIQAVSYDTIADWTFDEQYVKPPKGSIDLANNPTPSISNNLASAACIGFGTPDDPLYSSTFSAPGYSTNSADLTTSGNPYSSTGPSGQVVWRLRGQPGNGWLSTQPVGSQGAEFDVSTVNYSNVVITFDMYFTSQGEAKMCVLYTTNTWATTNVANSLGYGANPTLVVTNSVTDLNYSPHTVTGTYFFNTIGSLFYNDIVVDFTGTPNVANNPNFAFRIVNAATGGDCVNAINNGTQPYNNNSGNCRLDNVAVSGQYEGSYAPTVTNSSTATVDNPFTNTFAANPAWVSAIKNIYVNGVLLTNKAYTITSSNIVYNPAKAAVLQPSGLDSIVIYATGYTSAKVSQFVASGVFKSLLFTQPAGPSASSGTLVANPAFTCIDQYSNDTSSTYPSMVVTATVSNSPATWVLGGSTVQGIINGSCTFTDLTATLIGNTAISNAAIHFTISSGPIAATNSTTFAIGVPPVPFTPGNLAVMQVDTLNNNTTFSIIEVQPSTAGQTKPVNIVPISATGTNALRMSPSGSGGHMALSDDGTFLCFDAYQDGSSATPDETFNLNRAVGTLNYTNEFSSPVSYVSLSVGGSQARAACSPDNQNFIIDDKGGIYVNSGLSFDQNNISVRSFGGATWVLTAKAISLGAPTMYQFANDAIDGYTPNEIVWGSPTLNGPVITDDTNPPLDSVAQDFYMVATNGAYNIAYILDQGGGSDGASTVISKWIYNADADPGSTWSNIGWWTNGDNGDTLFATTNGDGGVYLYYANGGGGQGGNQIIRLTDATVGGPLNIISTNVIYTAPASASVMGVTFVPLQTAYQPVKKVIQLI